jgi:hypothetical protein
MDPVQSRVALSAADPPNNSIDAPFEHVPKRAIAIR